MTANESGRPDLMLLLAVLALVAFGILILMSASSVLGMDIFDNPYEFARRQLLFGILPGIGALALCAVLPYGIWRKLAIPVLFGILVLLILVFIPGIGGQYGGAARWITVAGFSVQPAEFAKLAVIMYLAALFASREEQHGHINKTLIPFLVVVGIVGILIALQPDVGTLVVVAGAAILMFFAAGARLTYIFGIIGTAAALLFLLIQSAPYRVARFTTFLHPDLDPSGIGYQVHQALLAVGSGGIWGLGFGMSRQKFRYLPEPAGDSIFAIAAEELGFLRMVVMLALFGFVFWRGYTIAREAPDAFGRFMAIGITSWLFIQTMVHIGANLAIAPLTGMPLPFISAGGSSLVVCLAAVGILINISRYSKSHA